MKEIVLTAPVAGIPAGTKGRMVKELGHLIHGEHAALLRVCGLDLEVAETGFNYVEDDKNGSGNGGGNIGAAGSASAAGGGEFAAGGAVGLPVLCQECGEVRGANDSAPQADM